VQHLKAERAGYAVEPIVLAVGRKLRSLLEAERPAAEHIIFLDGAGAAEEVESVLNRVINEFDPLQNEHGVLSVSILAHRTPTDLSRRELLPPFRQLEKRPPSFAHAPLIQLPPAELLAELVDQYLFASLYEILFASLLNENQRRVTHLEGAVKHLDDESAALTHRANALRQEEITEEIEVILLGTADLAEANPQRE
jgi:F-type H+-transporting ATPase subunit gamma